MNTFNIRKFLMGTGVLIWTSALAFTPQALAQEGADQEVEEITVTGSRIKRDTFSTTTPIQVLNTESAQRLGITSISELLQKATAASGEQVDQGFNASAGQTNATETPPDGGVGSACINLRGLGCERTLVLINGKRLGLAGIRGAPPQPDINMIPIGMVEGVDLLTGGLSTVYGADAVAGVVNVRLKKDFEGISLTANSELTEHEGGEIYAASLTAGVGNDLGNITMGIEYSRQERVTASDREFSKCYKMENYGRSQSVADGRIIDNCASRFIDNFVITSFDMFASGDIEVDDGVPCIGSDCGILLFSPGMSNLIDTATGEHIPNWSTFRNHPDTDSPTLNLIPSEVDDGTGGYLGRLFFTPLGQDEVDRALADSWRPYERFSLVMNGHVDLGGNNTEAYFEGYYFNRQNKVIASTEQIAPTVLGQVPLVDGSNNGIFFDPGTGLSVDAAGTPATDATGAGLLVQNPLNPFVADMGPIVTIDDAPQTFDTELQQSRLVAGLTGDITDDGRWSYDVSASYDRATGFVAQPVLLENHLFFATQTVGAVAEQDLCAGADCGADQVVGDLRFVLTTDTDNGADMIDGTADDSPTFGQQISTTTPVWTQTLTGEAVCGGDVVSDVVGVFTIPTCVPADFLNVSIGGDPLNGVSGHFATQAEKDYLIQNRTNRTVTEMMVLEGYVFGDLFDIPTGGTVGTAFGIQWREDQIDSQHSAIGVLGLNNAENPGQEGETRGSRTTFDAYAEISAPVVVDAAWADLFQIDAAIRFTDDEHFGNETVYKIGALWDINEYLSFNTSFNTSFRAPNLREQFLADQAGALSGSLDPCRNALFILMDDGPTKDLLLANCELSGADTDLLGVGLTVAIPVTTGGAAGLNPETSESFTATISASQPWTERFDFDIALTYFDIQIEDTVRSLGADTIINRCYFDQAGLASPFCQFVERDRPTAPPDLNFISQVRAGFVNTGEESATGMDISTRLLFDIGETTLNWSTAATIMDERLSQEFKPSEAMPTGSTIVNDVGRVGNPETTFQSTLAVTFRDWDFVWQARWWSDTEFFEGQANPVITDLDGLIVRGGPVGQDPDDVFDAFTEFQYENNSLIRDEFNPVVEVTEAEGQWQHDLAATYSMETMAFTLGINNVADEEPPCISWNAGPNRNCAVSSARYDLVGRSYFLRFTADF